MTGAEIALRLLAAFRALVDEVHLELARQGHPGVRPVHGFALQAIGPGATAGELAARLGVSKQAAGKTVDALVARGYVERAADPQDARRRLVLITPAGREVLDLSAQSFERLRGERAALAGPTRMQEFEAALRVFTLDAPSAVDTPGWSTDA